VRQPEFVDQPLDTCRLFHGIEIFALNIFDETDSQRRIVSNLADYDGHLI
jgi:hypothetical protein